MKFLSILFLLSFTLGCNPAEELSPPYVILQRDGVQLFIAGTYHYTTQEYYQLYEKALKSRHLIAEELRTSDVFFSETGALTLTREQQQSIQSILEPTDDKPSVQTIIDTWEPQRRERFLENLKSFPQLNHVGRQQTFLGMQPFASGDYLRAVIIPLAIGLPRDYSVDFLYMELAKKANLEHLGLESVLQNISLLDTMDQESVLESLELFLSLRPHANELTQAQNQIIQQMHKSFSTGVMDFSTIQYYEALGADAAYIQTSQSYNSLGSDVLVRQREEIWVQTIEDHIQSHPDRSKLFLAVGYGHLGHSDARFLPLLEQAGWVVAQVGFRVGTVE